MSPLHVKVLEAARSRWPECAWSAAFIEARLEEMPRAKQAWARRSEDLLWAWACLLGDARAIARFDSECIRDVLPNLNAMGLSADECDEVLQETRRKLLVASERGPAALARYRGAGPLGGFVRTVAVRLAVDLQRKSGRQPDIPGDLSAAVADGDHELDYLRAECSALLNRAVREAWESLPDQQQLLLRHQITDRLGIVELGRLYDIHPATAARRCGTAREALIRETKRRLRKQIGGGIATLSSVMRLLADGAEIPSVFEPDDS